MYALHQAFGTKMNYLCCYSFTESAADARSGHLSQRDTAGFSIPPIQPFIFGDIVVAEVPGGTKRNILE